MEMRSSQSKNPLIIGSALLLGVLSCTPMNAEEPALPYAAPEVTGVNQDGEAVDFKEFYGAGPVVVFFYPKADTPGCTRQACSLRDAYEELTDRGVRVIGVSADGVEAQKAFAEKFQLPYTLIADPEGKVIEAFGVERMGNGFATRQAFLIRDGKVVWRDARASTDQQAADVLKALGAE